MALNFFPYKTTDIFLNIYKKKYVRLGKAKCIKHFDQYI